MNIKPARRLILVEEFAPKDVSEGGIMLPQTDEKERKAQGIVVAKGDFINEYEVGDKLIFGNFAGDELKMDNDPKTYRFLAIDDILGKVC